MGHSQGGLLTLTGDAPSGVPNRLAVYAKPRTDALRGRAPSVTEDPPDPAGLFSKDGEVRKLHIEGSLMIDRI